LAVFVSTCADSDDFAFLRLLFRRLRQNDPASRRFFLRDSFDHNAITQRSDHGLQWPPSKICCISENPPVSTQPIQVLTLTIQIVLISHSNFKGNSKKKIPPSRALS